MSRFRMVGGMDGPAVAGQVHASASCIHHRLDTNRHSVGKPDTVAGAAEVGHTRGLVHLLSNSVTLQFADHGEPERLDV